ncbi:MAG: MFS transporter [Verrucomicrobiota bacterium]|nr:MFS transporter [Verrucomicrobiota bacterium]
MVTKPTKREIGSWCFFDFANSSFTTIIITVVFPPYFTQVIAKGARDADMMFAATFSISQWLVLLTAPFVGVLADIYGAKKNLLFISTFFCVLATLLLGVMPNGLYLSLSLFILGTVAYSSGENIVSGFLPELSTRETIGRISGISWGIGYCGGLFCLLLVQWVMTSEINVYGFTGVKLAFIATGLFFALSSLPTFLFLKERKIPEKLQKNDHILNYTLRKVRGTLLEARNNPVLWKFLGVFFLYSCGISTVIAFAGIYATAEFGYTQSELIKLFIALQISSTIGAFTFGFLQDRIGTRLSIQSSLILWMIAVLGAVLSQDKTHFFIVANIAGLCIGGSQCTSRAFVGQIAPSDKPAESFGYWGLFSRLAAATGPLAYGAVSTATGSGRIAILSTGVFFLAGWLGMFFIHAPPVKAEIKE